MENKITTFKSDASMEEAGDISKWGMHHLRFRFLYLLAVVIMIILGLSSRIFSRQLPLFVSAHFGDALWAAMIYFGWRALVVKKSLSYTALLALLFCFVIEFSQLHQADWINEIRNTLAGSLILGRGFLPIDLVRYTIGVGIAFLFDYCLLRNMFPAAKPPKTARATRKA